MRYTSGGLGCVRESVKSIHVRAIPGEMHHKIDDIYP